MMVVVVGMDGTEYADVETMTVSARGMEANG
jgi:hypothetical protein